MQSRTVPERRGFGLSERRRVHRVKVAGALTGTATFKSAAEGSELVVLCNQAKVSGQVVNGSQTQLNLQGEWKLAEGTSEECPTFLGFLAPFSLAQVAEGSSLYIAGK